MSHGMSSTLNVRAYTHLQLELCRWPGKGWWPFLVGLPRPQMDSWMKRLEQEEDESFEMQQLTGAWTHDKNRKQQY